MTCKPCGRDHAADDERERALRDAIAPGLAPFGILLRLEDAGWQLTRKPEAAVVQAAIAWHEARYPDLDFMEAFHTSDRLHEAVERLDTDDGR